MSVPTLLEQLGGGTPIRVNFKWSDSANNVRNLDADQCGRQMMRIYAKRGMLDPSVLLEEVSNNPESPIYRYLEWDDSVAAHKYRLKQCGDLIRWLEFEVVFHNPDSGGEEVKTARAFIAQGKRQALRAISDESSVGSEDQSDDDGGYVPSFVASNDSVSRIIRILIKEEIPQPDVGVLQNSPRKFTFMPTPVVMENRVLSRNYTAQLLADIERLVNRYRDYCELAGEGRAVLEQVLDELADLRLRWGDHLK